MTEVELLNKAEKFLKKYERIIWKPFDFPEDMTEESTVDELISEGTDMYYALGEAKDLIHDLELLVHFKDAGFNEI
jgi:hypothetical protein